MRREDRAVGKVAVIGEKRGIQLVGQDNVESAGQGQVVTVGPGGLQKQLDGNSSKRPAQKTAERLGRLVAVQNAVEFPIA